MIALAHVNRTRVEAKGLTAMALLWTGPEVEVLSVIRGLLVHWCSYSTGSGSVTVPGWDHAQALTALSRHAQGWRWGVKMRFLPWVGLLPENPALSFLTKGNGDWKRLLWCWEPWRAQGTGPFCFACTLETLLSFLWHLSIASFCGAWDWEHPIHARPWGDRVWMGLLLTIQHRGHQVKDQTSQSCAHENP